MLNPVCKALWGHYRRHPVQMLLVWLGLTLGIALLVGVMAVNQQAKISYKKGEQLFSNPYPYRIRSAQSNESLPQGFYIQLRRAGFSNCAPLELTQLTSSQGRDLPIIGIDPIAMINTVSSMGEIGQSQLIPLMSPPYPVMLNQSLAYFLGIQDGEKIQLKSGQKIGPMKIVDDDRVNGQYLLADLALLRQLKPNTGLSTVICSEMSPNRKQELKHLLPSSLVLERAHREVLEPLSEAFHLNLFAMGMLSFVIGLFIFYQAMSLSLSQRQPLVGVLRQLGVARSQLVLALAIELSLWIVLGLIGGNFLGLLLAQYLMPSVAATLNELYGANISSFVHWHWQWGLSSMAIALLGGVLSCCWPMIRLLKTQPTRLSTHQNLVRVTGKEFAWQAVIAVVLSILAAIVYFFAHDHITGFVVIALVLIAAGLFMPYFMWFGFHWLAKRVSSIRLRWVFTDASSSLTYRGVAAMAFMLALATNIGMETMVGSFRQSTETWLEQRLAADVYVRPPMTLAPSLVDWLEDQPEVEQIWSQWRLNLTTPKGKLQVMSIGARRGERNALSMKDDISHYWPLLHTTRSVLVSESLALRHGWKVGQTISLPKPMDGNWHLLGIYYDYGNPYGQVLISSRTWKTIWPHQGNVGYAIHLEDADQGAKLLRDLGEAFHLSPERVSNNADLLHHAMKVFDRTFVVTDTLSKLTLFIAVCGLFVATLAGEASRLRQFALMRCLGVSGKELSILGGAQLLMIGLVTAMMALPLGLLLAKFLIDVVLKYSFGWTMPIHYFPSAYLWSLGSALLVLLIGGAWPVWRLVKRSALRS
jgi:putative ABC transport system permease protein